MENVDQQDEDGKTALIYSAGSFANLEMVIELLYKGANTDQQDNDGKTALIHAVFHNDEDIVAILLKKNADVNQQDKNGKTALDYARLLDNVEIAEELLEWGATSGKPLQTGANIIFKYLKYKNKYLQISTSPFVKAGK